MGMDAMLAEQFVGPPTPLTPQDQMLGMIRKNSTSLPQYEDGRRDLLKAVFPLLIAQALDGVMTEYGVRREPPRGWGRLREGNPLPGMQHSAGRVGWGALESGIAALLMKSRPKIARPVLRGLATSHASLARNWSRRVERQDAIGK